MVERGVAQLLAHWSEARLRTIASDVPHRTMGTPSRPPILPTRGPGTTRRVPEPSFFREHVAVEAMEHLQHTLGCAFGIDGLVHDGLDVLDVGVQGDLEQERLLRREVAVGGRARRRRPRPPAPPSGCGPGRELDRGIHDRFSTCAASRCPRPVSVGAGIAARSSLDVTSSSCHRSPVPQRMPSSTNGRTSQWTQCRQRRARPASHPTEIAPETFVIHDHHGEGTAPVVGALNTMVIRAAEPVVVDTGVAENREQYLADVFSARRARGHRAGCSSATTTSTTPATLNA